VTRIALFLKNNSGATAVEYGIVASGITVAIVAVVTGLGNPLNTILSTIAIRLK
jgi:pilus assembly protein Flp/PilA